MRPNGGGAEPSLHGLIAQRLGERGSAGGRFLAEQIRTQYGAAVIGIIYYGSCFRTGSDEDGIIDLLVLVDEYRDVYRGRRGLALVNAFLPPNVFYLQTEFCGRTLRSKYAVISIRDFSRRTSRRCFHTYFWGRFAQPCALLYARDAQVTQAVLAAIATAVVTFIERVIPLLPDVFDAVTLWKQGLLASYATELRPERPAASVQLIDADIDWYQRVTAAAQVELSMLAVHSAGGDCTRYNAVISRRQRFLARQIWRLRRVQGKLLNLVRIVKATFTFDGGVDYVLWKIERHSGVRVEATPMLRRYPLLTCWGTLWRLYRRGAFR